MNKVIFGLTACTTLLLVLLCFLLSGCIATGGSQILFHGHGSEESVSNSGLIAGGNTDYKEYNSDTGTSNGGVWK